MSGSAIALTLSLSLVGVNGIPADGPAVFGNPWYANRNATQLSASNGVVCTDSLIFTDMCMDRFPTHANAHVYMRVKTRTDTNIDQLCSCRRCTWSGPGPAISLLRPACSRARLHRMPVDMPAHVPCTCLHARCAHVSACLPVHVVAHISMHMSAHTTMRTSAPVT